MNAGSLLRKLPYRDKVVLINGKQAVPDIMREVLNAHEWYANDYDKIAEDFNYSDLSEAFKKLFEFLKRNVRYREETEKKQTTKSPAHILIDRIGDCKHYSLFIGGVLNALQRIGRKFKWSYRFASYDGGDRMPGHVFVVAWDKGKEFWIDPVLNEFDFRYRPQFYIDRKPKNSNMALYRIGAVEDYSNSSVAVMDSEDAELSPELVKAIQLLLYYGVMNANGKINDKRLTFLHTKISPEAFRSLANARLYVQNQVVNGFFSGVFRAVKKVTLFAPRAAFLGLVRLNAFGFATKLHAATWTKAGAYTTEKPKIKDLWQKKLGGDWAVLEQAIKKGAAKKAILGAAPAAVPAWLATASAVIALIMPLVNSFIKNQQSAGVDLSGGYADLQLPSDSSGGGVMQWVEENPLIVLGVGAAAVYFLTSKKAI